MRTINWATKGSKGETYYCRIKLNDETKTILWIDCECWNFVNRRIIPSGQLSDKKYQFAEPCKHLKKQVDALIQQGYTLKKPKPMTGTDKCTTELRRFLVERSAGVCEMYNCVKTGIEVHRKIPKTNGGKYNKDNCVLLCPDCHRKMTFQKWQGSPGAKK